MQILCSQTRSLQGLLGAGFQPGLRPREGQPSVTHHDLFPLVAKTLAIP